MKAALQLLTPKHRLTIRAIYVVLAAWGALAAADGAKAQLPSVLYTWDDRGNPSPHVEDWFRWFPATSTATFDNATPGRLTITETSETPGAGQAFADHFNRLRETLIPGDGGLDLTGLEYLEFDLGHNGAGPVNVQFFTYSENDAVTEHFVALAPDMPVAPGMNTYRIPLSVLTPEQKVYNRLIGFNVREHAALGNLTWWLDEVRSVGAPLKVRDIITHAAGTADGGLQSAFVNYGNAAVLGNDGGQNQTGLSWNPAGTGSLQWTDLANAGGAAITWGNGTTFHNNNTFWTRPSDLSGYTQMVIRLSATDPNPDPDPEAEPGVLRGQAIFQKNAYSDPTVAVPMLPLPIDGQFHDRKFSLAGLTNMNVVDVYGLQIFGHEKDLVINVDNIQFRNVVFLSKQLFTWESGLEGWTTGPEAGHVHSVVSTTSNGLPLGSSKLKIDRTSVEGSDPDPMSSNHSFVLGSNFTTTNAATIADMVPAISRATTVAFDVTYQDGLDEGTGANPSFTNFYIEFDDHNGGLYQAATAGINLNGAPLTTTTLEIPLDSFVDPTPMSTKKLTVDGLLESTNQFTIRLATNTDDGSIYYIDNFRLITEQISDEANFNPDSVVDGGDLELWKLGFGANRAGDADGDNDTDGNDFLAWQRQFGNATPPVAGVPEPAAAALALFAALAVVRSRR